MSRAEAYDAPKRIALVVSALTGDELKAGSRDVSRIYELLTDPELGECSIADSSSPIYACSSVSDFEKNVLQGLLKKWRSKDQLLFYFTGHGRIENGIYCLQIGPDKDEVLPFATLLLKLQLYRVDRAILIIDACFSGEATKTNDLFSPPDNLPKGIAIISSSRPTQVSHELEDGSASVFTDVFYQGIKTGLGGKPTSDGKVAVEDIVDFIKDELEHNEKYTEYGQHPQFKIIQADRSIWVSKNKSGSYEKINQSSTPQAVFSMEELRFLAENTPFSKHPCPEAAINDLDWDLVETFLKEIHPEIDKNIAKEDILKQIGFFSPIPHLGQQKLHKSAVLCFANRPDVFYPQAKSIFVVGNEGAERFIRETVTGPLSKQVTSLTKKVVDRLDPVSYIAKDGKRLQKLEIDEYVIRELISNAITHRDYNSNGSVKVSLNNEFLEISSPGDFPPRTSWDGFLKNTNPVSQPINVIVSHYLAHVLVFEGIGRGFEIVRKHIEEYGKDSIACALLPGPIISVRVRRQTSPSSSKRFGTQSEREEMIDVYKRRLQVLKVQEARLGINTSPDVLLEVDDLERKIAELQAELLQSKSEITQNPDKEIQSLEEILRISTRRLQLLKEKSKATGVNTPPEVIIEIEDLERRVVELQSKLTQLQQS